VLELCVFVLILFNVEPREHTYGVFDRVRTNDREITSQIAPRPPLQISGIATVC